MLPSSFVHCFTGSEFASVRNLNFHFFFPYEALTQRINGLIKKEEDKQYKQVQL